MISAGLKKNPPTEVYLWFLVIGGLVFSLTGQHVVFAILFAAWAVSSIYINEKNKDRHA